jgi:hypothetical protein
MRDGYMRIDAPKQKPNVLRKIPLFTHGGPDA